MENYKMTLMGVLVTFGFVVAWSLGVFAGKDPQVAELEQKRDAAFQNMDQLSDEDRREQFSGFRESVQQLTEEQRRQFMESSRPLFQQMMLRRMDQFFDLTEQEQQEKLDEMIDRIEQWRTDRQDGGEQGKGGRGNRTSAERDQRQKEMLDRTTPELRAKMGRYKDMLNERREERGLEPIEGGRGMFGKGGMR